MTKPTIVTRAGKGSALTWTEGDTNLTNLRDATITVSDGTNTKAIDLNGTIQFAAGSNTTVAVNSSTGVVTIGTSGSLNTNLNYVQAGGGTRVSVTTGATFPATIISVSITTTGGPVLINAYGDTENTTAGGWCQLQLYRGTTALGTVVHAEGSAGSENCPYSLNYIDNPSAGTYTYYLKVNNIAGGTFNFGESYAPIINVTELKGVKGDTGATGATGAAGASTLSALTDIELNAYNPLADNDVLLYDYLNSKWYNISISSLSVFSATHSDDVLVALDTTTATNEYPLFVSATSGRLAPKTNSSYTYNPNTGTLTAGTFSGSHTGSHTGTGSFTTLSASSSVSGTGFSNYFAAPPAIGSGAANTGAFTTLSASSTVSGTGFTNRFASPGPIGSTTASTGAFTTLSASGNTSLSGANAAISLQPTGTGIVTINPATTSNMDNMIIGATTAKAGTFTTLTINGTNAITLAGATPTISTGSTGSIDNFNIGATTARAGTFTTLTSTGRTVIKDLTETVYSLTYAATITPDVANGTVQKVTLTGAVTFSAFANPVAGQSLTLIVTQDATGGRALTSTMKFAGASKTLSTAANAVDIITVFYDGTTYWASLGKGFA